MKETLRALAAAGALCGLVTMTAAAGTPKKSDPAADAAMAEMMKYANPGPQHEKLKAMEGTWDAVVKSWMGPGEPVVSKGVMKNEMELGGRVLESKYKGEFQGQPFDGFGMTGYDLKADKLLSLWTDTMSTSWMVMDGKMSSDGKEMTTTGTMDGMDGKPMPVRTVTKIEGPDKHVYSMYGQMNGQEVPVMEITYTRKK
jgi:hypothetical protein